MKRLRGGIIAAIWIAVLLVAGVSLYGYARSHPENLPWTELDLGQPVGMFTGRKLAALGGDYARCQALLDRAGVRYDALPPREGANEACGYSDGIRLSEGGSRTIGFAPDSPAVACPVAAASAMWEWNVLQPAARRHFDSRVTAIRHLGSYSCRRMYGRDTGAWSEHATADALDVAGFTLEDGTEISVLGDWNGDGAKAAFLRDVRDGGCRLFATVLSPDYNDAHRDHLHLDQAQRGNGGWRACR